jgi:hypothetical protein
MIQNITLKNIGVYDIIRATAPEDRITIADTIILIGDSGTNTIQTHKTDDGGKTWYLKAKKNGSTMALKRTLKICSQTIDATQLHQAKETEPK